MTLIDDYAREREQRRVTRTVSAAALVIVFGAVAAFVLDGSTRIVVVVVVVLVLLLFGVAWARVPKPAELVGLSPGERSGRWSASTPALTFPDVLARRPQLSRTSELLGTVQFVPGGVVWEPSPQTARYAGVGSTIWDSSWTPHARRLRGASGLVQLTLVNAAATQPVTFWLRRASDFQIP